MKAKISLQMVVLVSVLALGLTACTRGVNDAQLANDVQYKIGNDRNIQSRQITVQAQNGVVTLSGQVSNDMERAAAANDAATVNGVKTVVNNLQVAAPEVSQTPALQGPAPEPVRRAPVRRRTAPAVASSRPVQTYSDTAAVPAPTVSLSPTAPAPVRRVTVPAGTTVSVRLLDSIDTERNQMGETFRATLASPIMVEDEVVVPQNADVVGRIAELKSAGHFTGQSQVALELSQLNVNGKTYTLNTNQYSREGTSRGKRTAATVGGGAALGAIIGGIAGGGKGAAIGATVGAGAGTGVQAATKGQQIKLPSETVLTFQLQSPLTVVAASGLDRNAGRQRVD